MYTMFINPFPNAFGLDINDLSIKLVQLRRSVNLKNQVSFSPKIFRSIDLPAGLIVNGELQQPEEVRKKILHLLQGNKKQKPVKSPWVVTALPETHSFIKLINIAKPAEELFDDEIKTLAKKHIPFDEDDNYYIEWQIMPGGDEHNTRVLVGAVSQVVADSYTYLLESLGLGVVALEIEALAIARSLITASKPYENEARAILDIGATRSDLIVYDHDIVQFSTTLNFSGELLTTALEQKLHLSHEEAEKLKIEIGLNYKSKKNKAWAIIAEITNELEKQLKTTMQFYYSHFPDANRITRITMCGGASNLKYLDRVLSAKLKVLCRPGHPWKNLNCKKKIDMSDSESLSYATAIGLALRAADNPFFTRNVI